MVIKLESITDREPFCYLYIFLEEKNMHGVYGNGTLSFMMTFF